jgi:hypothetical protein
MRPVLKRILMNGGLTAGVLALVGLLFAELATLWATSTTGRPSSATLNPQLPDSVYYRVPLTLALGGFLFVAVGELVLRRLRRNKPAAAGVKSGPSQQDDVEKLLNELLAQAEAKMAAEKAENREQKTEDREQKTEEKKPEIGPGEKKAEERAGPEPEKPTAPPA